MGPDTFSYVGNSAVWTIGSLPPSRAINLQFSVLIGLSVSNGTGEGSLASIQSSNAPTASASVLSVIGARPDFLISKTAPNPSSPQATSTTAPPSLKVYGHGVFSPAGQETGRVNADRRSLRVAGYVAVAAF